MKRLLTTLAVTAVLLAVALPAQASTGHRYRLGTSVSVQERAMFGCDSPTKPVRSFLVRGRHGRYSITPVGTVTHQRRIVGVCRWVFPHFTRAVTPLPSGQWPCDWNCTPAVDPTV